MDLDILGYYVSAWNKVFIMNGIWDYEIGERVEKYTGAYTTFGEVRATYTTKGGARRYVVEVEPQGFQMIWSDKELRSAPALTPGHPAATIRDLLEQPTIEYTGLNAYVEYNGTVAYPDEN